MQKLFTTASKALLSGGPVIIQETGALQSRHAHLWSSLRNCKLNVESLQTRLIIPSSCTSCLNSRNISTSSPLESKQAGRFKVSRKHDNPLTYEESFKPHHIAHVKYWNSLNNTNFPDFGLRCYSVLTEDAFIRRFMTCTWHKLFVSEIIIKRQANMIRIAGIVQRRIPARKMYFLIGYTEELLSHWIQCPIKLELQTVEDKKDVIFKYV